ncbi:hypothetical protein Scep_005655 [Stephania cephalantha]|uniref:Protein kinase domain-containing protein n=1 Tax=Stephania cephalantha TaxID=152367 RepID=A0AAP0KUP9_9MAGN
MAVSDIESVLGFLRKNGLAEAESAFRDDICERGDSICGFDFEKFEFPMSPRPPKLKIMVGERERSSDGRDELGGSDDDDDEEDFVSLGSNSDRSSSAFSNPYGLLSITCAKSEGSSDGHSEFGTARDYHDSDIFNDLYWYDDKDRDRAQSGSLGGTDLFICPSEDKFVTTLEADEQYKEAPGLDFASEGFCTIASTSALDLPFVPDKIAIDDVDDVPVKDVYHWDCLQPEQGIDEGKVGHGKNHLRPGNFSDFRIESEENHVGESNDSSQMKTFKEPNHVPSRLKDARSIPCDSDFTSDHYKKSEPLPFSENSFRPDEVNGYGDDREAVEEPHDPEATLEDDEHSSANEFPMCDGYEDDYEVFNLRIIHGKNRTGFEENKDFPIILNTIIAGRYYVTEYLGSAAFSKVVQAHDLQTGIDVCLKIIKNDKDFFDQSLDEIKLLKFVNKYDPADENHILRLYDYFYHQEHLFIVCELLRANLYEYQKFNQESGGEVYFTLRRLQIIARQCLEALEYLHHLGIIHCDLKPENVLMKSYSRCEIKVIDLGSSCFQTDNLCLYVQSRSYRAPEVILGLPYDQKIDLWSLGCIMAELCSGDVLFPNDGLVMLLARIIGMLGPIDMEMLENGQETHKYFTKEYDLYYLNEVTDQIEYIIPEKFSLEHHLNASDAGFTEFVKYLLEVNPSRRPTASDALQHPWLSHLYE